VVEYLTEAASKHSNSAGGTTMPLPNVLFVRFKGEFEHLVECVKGNGFSVTEAHTPAAALAAFHRMRAEGTRFDTIVGAMPILFGLFREADQHVGMVVIPRSDEEAQFRTVRFGDDPRVRILSRPVNQEHFVRALSELNPTLAL